MTGTRPNGYPLQSRAKAKKVAGARVIWPRVVWLNHGRPAAPGHDTAFGTETKDS